jgi:hypothetical protein
VSDSDQYRSALPYNRQAGTTGPADETATLFSEAYIYGTPLGEHVPPPPPMLSQAADAATSELDEPNWTNVEGDAPPETPSGGPSNGRWYYWTGVSSLTVQLHNNQNILAVWLPQEPSQIITVQSGQGAAGGIGIYNTQPYTSGEQVASETIAIPSGHPSLTLTAAAAFTTPILVLISGEPYPPSKTFLSTVTAANITASITLPVEIQNASVPVTEASFALMQTASVSNAGSGTVTVVPAVAGKSIYVMGYSIVTSTSSTAGGPVNVLLEPVGGTSAIVLTSYETPTTTGQVGNLFEISPGPYAIMICSPDTALQIVGGAYGTSGTVFYMQF